jgi:hypothetical protein
MTNPSTLGIKTVLPVADLTPQSGEPIYVGFDVEGEHIGLVLGGGPQAR